MSSLETFKNAPEEEEGEHMAVIMTAGRIFKSCQQRYSYAHELWRRCQKSLKKSQYTGLNKIVRFRETTCKG